MTEHFWLSFAIVSGVSMTIPLIIHLVLRHRRMQAPPSNRPCVRVLEKAEQLVKRAEDVAGQVAGMR